MLPYYDGHGMSSPLHFFSSRHEFKPNQQQQEQPTRQKLAGKEEQFDGTVAGSHQSPAAAAIVVSPSSSRLPLMEVWVTKSHVTLKRKGQFIDSLWYSREDGSVSLGTNLNTSSETLEHVLCHSYGLIGKIRFLPDSDWYLLLITEARDIGSLPPTGSAVYCVEGVTLVRLSAEKSIDEIKMESYAQDRREKDVKEKEKLEKKLQEALLQMFNGSRSFYFSYDADLTQSLQRKHDCGDAKRLRNWQRVDERFFWNKNMLSHLIDNDQLGHEIDDWVLPVIQGYIEIKQVPIPSMDQLGVFEKDTVNVAPSHKSATQDDELLPVISITSPEDVPVISITSIENVSSTSPEDVPVVNSFLPEDVPVISSTSPKDAPVVGSTSPEDVPVISSTSPEDAPVVSGTSPEDVPVISSTSPEDVPVINSTSPLLIEDITDTLLTENVSKTNASSSWTNQISTSAITPPAIASDTKSSNTSLDELDDFSNIHSALVDPSHVDDPMDTPTPKASPLIPRHDIARTDDSATPLQLRTASCDNLSHNSFDTDDLMNERLEGEEEHEIEGDSTNDHDSLPWNKQTTQTAEDHGSIPTITMVLVSRRSRYRAGTRYLRRGVDEEGNVANYVETEMILQVKNHLIAFMVVRGSVPVYWTQPGNKYRPLPIIQRADETFNAFEKHFENQINLYEEEVIINLVNQSGRERIVSLAYETELIKLNIPTLTYVAFDFHRHCKVNQWHNINLLLNEIGEYITRQKYLWVNLESNSREPLCVQRGAFRVNCMDCLDRTNVVQSVICKEIVQTVLQKLGLLTPFDAITGQFLRHYQELWANNGDTISRQYTGTDAMKGDLTRYGTRKLYGVMKDGYNSAHRYIQSLFRDAYRQVVIDLQQGVLPQEALTSLPQSQRRWDDEEQFVKSNARSDLPSWTSEREQTITDMIKTCRDDLFPNESVPVKGWALIEPAGYSFVPASQRDEDTVLLLCEERRHICVANYSSDFDQVACCIRIPLDRIERICVGPIGTILRSSRKLYMRIHYTLFPGCSCYFTFRSVHSLSLEEDKLTLLGIAQELAALQPAIAIQEQRLSKKPSRSHEGIVFLMDPSEWEAMQTEEEITVGGETRFYSQLSDTSSGSNTPNHRHSRQSSTASGGIIALIKHPDQDQSGYETDSDGSDDDEGEVSLSAPSSPDLTRRTTMMSLQERSQLISRSSLEDIQSCSNEEEKEIEKTHRRVRSYGFVILRNTSPEADDEADEEEVVDIHKVLLSTSRVNSIHFPDSLNISSPSEELKVPDVPSSSSSTNEHRSMVKAVSSPVVSSEQEHSSMTKQVSEQSLSKGTDTAFSTSPVETDPSTPASPGKRRWNIGRLFQKGKTQQQQQQSETETSVSSISGMKQNVIQAIGILKGLKLRDKDEQHMAEEEYLSTALSEDEIADKQWMAEAMRTSKTRFIII